MSRRWLARALGCIVIAMLSGGCGKKDQPPPIVPAQGVVLLNGAPLPKAAVQFIPQAKLGLEFMAGGVTDDQGRFTLQCNGQPGACAGDSTVTVTDLDIPSRLRGENAQSELAAYLRSLKNRPIPPKYNSPATSPLHVNVSEGQKEFKLELRR